MTSAGPPSLRRPLYFVVPREAEGTRLDRFLAMALASVEGGPSRTELQRWIEHGAVRVDGAVKKPSEKLHEGARLDVVPEPPPRSEATPDAGVVFDIVYKDDALLVIDKPAGLVVHPARGHETGTLVNGLLARGMFDSLDDDDAKDRPGIVHRLDKGTSGLMVVARTPRAREALKTQFAAHSIEREYIALAVGATADATIESLHGRHPTDRLKFSSKVKTGKRAVTHVRALERFGPHATFVACRLETGRTHQIRVHLADARTPLLADPLYGKTPKHPVLRDAAEALGRTALHARVLGFVHPTTGKTIRFEAEPPGDFQLALATLRAIPL